MTEVTTSPITLISMSNLPPIGAPLDAGTFVGMTKHEDGFLCAVVLLPGRGGSLTLSEAIVWAEQQGGELPTRSVAAMLPANDMSQIKPVRCWTSEDDDSGFALYCYITTGRRLRFPKSSTHSAVAVRLIPITA